MDIYCEQSVENQKIDKNLKKQKVLGIVKYVLLFAGLVLGYILFMGALSSSFDGSWAPFIFQCVFAVLSVVPFVLAFIFIGKYINNANIEYDYVITDGNFRIVKVINRKKRKKMVEFSLSSIESIGRLSAENYDRYAASKDIKKQFAICNVEDEDAIIYIYYGHEGARFLLHIEPNDEMSIGLRRSVTRVTVIDKSLKMPINTVKADTEKN